MDYFNNVYYLFLGLESGNNVAVHLGVRKISGLIKKIYICVPNLKVLWVWNDMKVSNY